MRYRLKLATWTVIREPTEPSPRALSDPTAVARLAQDLLKSADDDREHFWSILLNAQNHFPSHTWCRSAESCFLVVLAHHRRRVVDFNVIEHPTQLIAASLVGYFEYYRRAGTYLSLHKDAPDVRSVQPREIGRIMKVPEVGGLHHRYVRAA